MDILSNIIVFQLFERIVFKILLQRRVYMQVVFTCISFLHMPTF